MCCDRHLVGITHQVFHILNTFRNKIRIDDHAVLVASHTKRKNWRRGERVLRRVMHTEKELVSLGEVVVFTPVIGDEEDPGRVLVLIDIFHVEPCVPATPLQGVLDDWCGSRFATN